MHVVGLSILSGSHVPLVRRSWRGLRARGPRRRSRSSSAASSRTRTGSAAAAGVARVYTPKDYRLNELVTEIAGLVAETAEA